MASDHANDDRILACAIAQDLESFEQLINEMQAQFNDNWGGLELEDAIPVLSSVHADQMEHVVLAVTGDDEVNMPVITQIIDKAKSRGLQTTLVTRDVNSAMLHALLKTGADGFVPYPMPNGALQGAIGTVTATAATMAPAAAAEPVAMPMAEPAQAPAPEAQAQAAPIQLAPEPAPAPAPEMPAAPMAAEPAPEPATLSLDPAPQEPVIDPDDIDPGDTNLATVTGIASQLKRAVMPGAAATPEPAAPAAEVMPAATPEPDMRIETHPAFQPQPQMQPAAEAQPAAAPAPAPQAPVAAAPVAQPPAADPAQFTPPAVVAQAAAGGRDGLVFPVYPLAGGVGASTFAANLAWEMQAIAEKENKRVCILDFAFQYGAISTYLDVARSDASLELLTNIGSVDDQSFEQSMRKHNNALSVFSTPVDAVPLEIVGGEEIGKIIDIARSQYDYVFIDMPNALTSWTEAVLDRAKLFFAISELEMRSAQNALRFLRALKADDLPYEKVQFIINRAPKRTDLNGRSRIKRMSDSLNVEFRWLLPDGGKQVVAACDQGATLASSAARNPLRKEIRKIAVHLTELSTSLEPARASA